jgi:hypothetical protein
MCSLYSNWLWTGQPRDQSLSPRGPKIVTSPYLLDWLWGPPILLSNGYRGALSLELKQLQCNVDHSHPTTAEVKSKSRYNWQSVSQSFSQYVKVSSSLWDLWPNITFCPKVVFWKLLLCLCEAPSLTRGQVCHLSFSVCSNLLVFTPSIYVTWFYSSAIYIQ